MKHLGLVSLALVLIACSPSSEDPADANEIDPIVGNDRTEQGCIPSAGYQWSILSRTCVRVWEAGVALTHQGSGDPNFNAYAITSDDQAEVFLPKQSESIILMRDKANDGALSWSNPESDLRLGYDPADAMILTDSTGFVMYRYMADAPTIDEIPDHAADDLGGDYVMDQGVVTEVEDGAYPLFTLYIQLDGETESTPFSLMAEGVSITGGSLYELAGKAIHFDYVDRESWDLISINSADDEAYVPETVGDEWRFVIGRLEGAEEVSMGDLPDTLSITTLSGEQFEFDNFVGDTMVELNESDVAAWLAPRSTKDILSITVTP